VKKTVIVVLLLLLMAQIWITIFIQSPTMDEGKYLYNASKIVREHKWTTVDSVLQPPFFYYLCAPLFKIFHLTASLDQLFAARILASFFALLLAWYVFLWARELYGQKAAIMALVLVSFSPVILAYAGLITMDVIVTCFITMACYYLWRFIKEMSLKNVCLAGLTLGLALTSKYSALILLPLYLAVLVLVFSRPRAKALITGFAAIGIISLLVINALYGFQGTGTSLGALSFKSGILKHLAENKLFAAFPTPVPAPYLLGVDYQKSITENGFPLFFLGQKYFYGTWWYFIVSFLIRTPVPLLILILATAIMSLRKSLPSSRDDLYLLSLAVGFLLYCSFFNKSDNGYRYILPIYPLTYIWISKLALCPWKGKAFKRIGLALMSWYIIGTLAVAPSYLAYANEFVGGARHLYRYTANADLDWGQNEKLLARYLARSQEPYQINPRLPVTGKIIVDVNELHGIFRKKDYYGWLKAFTPVGNIGYSKIIYDIKLADLEAWAESQPGEALAAYALGAVYLRSGDNSKAIASLQKSLSLAPELGEGYYLLACAYARAGEIQKAIDTLETSIKKAPDFLPGYKALSFLYEYDGRTELAIALEKRAIWQEAINAHIRPVPLQTVFYEGKIEAGESAAGIYSNLGILYWAKGDLDKAQKYLEKAKLADPLMADVYNNLAFIYKEQGLSALALGSIDSYLRLRPLIAANRNQEFYLDNDRLVYGNMLTVSPVLTKYYSREMELSKKPNAADYNILGRYYWQEGQPRQALVSFRKALQAEPGSREARENIDILYHKLFNN
jgi:4-amino-4-deoxy-L-arabinose transferase-like glycosyltransferase/Tfp pilus assembly protein PilF